MYRIGTFLCILLLPQLVSAQADQTSVRGVVYDSSYQRGLAYATVSVVTIKDSTLVSFVRADSLGYFHIHSLAKGKYFLSASYVGYVPVWQQVELKTGQELNIGKLLMTDLAKAGNVTVTARRAPVTINNDTVEFNAENFKTAPNAVVEDMLKKMPGVTVDNDGTVRVNGQRINRILVNGKEFFTGDPHMATKNLDADAVDKVQVFDKKSDRSTFTGVDDGQSEKAINLKLKKDRNNALFGRVTAGGGTKERFDGQTNLNQFNGDRQFSALGMANNTNRQGFSMSDVMNFTGDLARGMRNGGGGITIRVGSNDDNGLPVTGLGQNQQGVARTAAGGVNYNDNWRNKTDVNTSVMLSDVHLLTDKSTNRENLSTGNGFNYQSASNSIKDNKQQRWNAAVDHKIDSFTSVKFTPRVTAQQNDSRAHSNYSSVDNKGVLLNTGLTESRTHAEALNLSGTALYRQRMKKKGRTLSATITYTYNNSKQNGDLYTRNTSYAGGIPAKDSIVNQKNTRDATTRNLATNIIYTEPVGKRSLLEAGVFYNTNSGVSNRKTFDYNGGSGKYDQFNNQLSNDFTSHYNFGGASLAFRSNQRKVNYTIGTSWQAAVLESADNTNGNRLRQSFTDLLPNASLQWKIGSTRNLNLNFSTSVTQPSTVQLQPLKDVSDPLNTYTGNPDLQRSYTQSVSLNYFSSNLYTQRSFFAFLTATKTDRAIVNSDVIQNGLRATQPVNADGVYFLFGNLNTGFVIKPLKSRLEVGIGTNYSRNIAFINQLRNTIENMSVGPNLGWNYSLEGRVDIQANARLNISKASYSLQPQLNSNYLQQVYALDMTNYLPWALVLNNSFNYTINSGRASGYNTQVPYWNASLAKSFLENNRGELKLSALDLLNRNIGVSRNANQNYIEDTRYNVLQRYFLLSFTYRLNKASTSSRPNVAIRTFGGN